MIPEKCGVRKKPLLVGDGLWRQAGRLGLPKGFDLRAVVKHWLPPCSHRYRRAFVRRSISSPGRSATTPDGGVTSKAVVALDTVTSGGGVLAFWSKLVRTRAVIAGRVRQVGVNRGGV